MTVTGKADRMVAERAQRQRKESKLAHRRQVYKDSLDQVLEEERIALMKKHGLKVPLLNSSNNSRVSTANLGHTGERSFPGTMSSSGFAQNY